jgi:hypothetical protein
MWAFGVLLFYMLNLTYPFCTHLLIQKSTPTGVSRTSARSFAGRPIISATARQWQTPAKKSYRTALRK